MENKKLVDFTDIELAEALSQLYKQLMQVQNGLMAIEQETAKRRNDQTKCPTKKD